MFKASFQKGTITFIKATPGPDKVTLYTSTQNIYPCSKDFQYKSISISESSLDNNGNYYDDFEPFKLDNENNLIYVENPAASKFNLSINSVAIKIETEHGIFGAGMIYIGIYNQTQEELDFSICAQGQNYQKLRKQIFYQKIIKKN